MRAMSRDELAWRRLVQLYSPMVYRWARKAGLQKNDSQDVVQDVFLAVASDIDHFRRSRPGDSFRGWLWTIGRHKILDHFRKKKLLVPAVGGSAARQRIEQFSANQAGSDDECGEICRLRHRAVALLREQFENYTWQAFHRTVIQGDRPTDVARDLGISVATVYRAKFQVLSRLQSELEGL